MTCGHRRCRVIQGLLVSHDAQWRSAECSCDPPRHSHGLRFPFHRKNLAFKRWNGDSAERLQRMDRSDRRAALLHGFQDSRVHRTAGVQDNSAAQLFFANPRQLLRNHCDFVIGCGDQDQPRRQDLPCHARAGLPCPNKPDGPPRACLIAGNNRTNLPSKFTQPASQRAAHASRTDDRQAIWHPVLA